MNPGGSIFLHFQRKGDIHETHNRFSFVRARFCGGRICTDLADADGREVPDEQASCRKRQLQRLLPRQLRERLLQKRLRHEVLLRRQREYVQQRQRLRQEMFPQRR